jgi:hypothetical protein
MNERATGRTGSRVGRQLGAALSTRERCHTPGVVAVPTR